MTNIRNIVLENGNNNKRKSFTTYKKKIYIKNQTYMKKYFKIKIEDFFY